MSRGEVKIILVKKSSELLIYCQIWTTATVDHNAWILLSFKISDHFVKKLQGKLYHFYSIYHFIKQQLKSLLLVFPGIMSYHLLLVY